MLAGNVDDVYPTSCIKRDTRISGPVEINLWCKHRRLCLQTPAECHLPITGGEGVWEEGGGGLGGGGSEGQLSYGCRTKSQVFCQIACQSALGVGGGGRITHIVSWLFHFVVFRSFFTVSSQKRIVYVLNDQKQK